MNKILVIGIVILFVVLIGIYIYKKQTPVPTVAITPVVPPVVPPVIVIPKTVSVLPTDATLFKTIGTNIAGTTRTDIFFSKSTGWYYSINRFNGRTGGAVATVYLVSEKLA